MLLPCFSDPTAVLGEYLLCSFYSWFNWPECLICTTPVRSAGTVMCISHPQNLTGAGDVRCLYFCVVSVLHICTTAEQSFRECKLCLFFPQHLVFMRAGVCVYVCCILEDDLINDFNKWWMNAFSQVSMLQQTFPLVKLKGNQINV